MLIAYAVILSAFTSVLAATSRQLNAQNFKQAVSTGTWFIEHYSPTCSHCIAFEPTWSKLADEFDQYINFGQIDCNASKDLCSANSVTGTPSLVLFTDGTIAEKYAGSNAYKDLATYLQSHLIATPSFSQSTEPNPFGEVVELSENNFKSYIGKEGDDKLVWVKYFAPWCPHCQHLAPVWEELAVRFKGKLTIASVDCDKHHALCQKEKVKGYPTLSLYSNTHKKVYKDGRSLEKMSKFAKKVLEPPSGLRDITIDEFEKATANHEVFYLFLHSRLSSNNNDLDLLNKALKGLIGGPTVFKSRDDRLFDKYNVSPNEGSVLLAFKDNDWRKPASEVRLGDLGTLKDELDDTLVDTRVKELTNWLKYNAFPTIVDAATVFNELLDSEIQQYLVILPLDISHDDQLIAKEKLADIARVWRTGGRNMLTDGFLKGGPGSSTIFAWVDANKYSRWLRNMYGYINKPLKHGENRQKQIIIADPNRLEYYDVNLDGQATILDGHSIFSALEGIYQGQLQPKSSQNAFEYTVQAIHKRILSYKQTFIDHPLRMFIISVLLLLAVGILLYTLTIDNKPDDDSLHLFSSGTKGSARDYYQPSHKENRRID
ncbi:thioredoxin-like protein [Wallemia mellicola]|nr:thioredoxin-like protein [Wallemia mellicola]